MNSNNIKLICNAPALHLGAAFAGASKRIVDRALLTP